MDTALDISPSSRQVRVWICELERETLHSMDTLLKALASEHYVDEGSVAPARQAVGVLRLAHGRRERVLSPELYSWYFQAIELLEQRDFAELARLVRSLPAVALPDLVCTRLQQQYQLTVPPDGVLSFGAGRRYDMIPPAWVGRHVQACSRGQDLVLTGHDGEERVVSDGASQEGPNDIWISGTPLRLRQGSSTMMWQVGKYEKNLSNLPGYKPGWRLVARARFFGDGDHADQPHKIAAGLSILGSYWPELRDELFELTRYVALVDGAPFAGGSDVASFGISYFGATLRWSDLAWADHLTHEAAHQWLHAVFEARPPLLNPAEQGVRSPIRTDPRPLMGTFHATFVFLRLSQLMERVVRRWPSHDAITRLHRHLLGFLAGMDALKRFARFTPYGERFFAALRVEEERLRGALPAPDPELYNAIANDYEKPCRLQSALLE